MEIKYTVRSSSEDEVSVLATVPGLGQVTAKVPGLVVELVSEDGGMGHTYRITPEDMAVAKDFFTVGDHVKITFSKTK